ncbi:unnamed protein product [Ectocarpus sp. 12 AP-2014]
MRPSVVSSSGGKRGNLGWRVIGFVAATTSKVVRDTGEPQESAGEGDNGQLRPEAAGENLQQPHEIADTGAQPSDQLNKYHDKQHVEKPIQQLDCHRHHDDQHDDKPTKELRRRRHHDNQYVEEPIQQLRRRRR